MAIKLSKLLCVIGWHKWAYQREAFDNPGVGPNRACLRCYGISQTWKNGKWETVNVANKKRIFNTITRNT